MPQRPPAVHRPPAPPAKRRREAAGPARARRLTLLLALVCAGALAPATAQAALPWAPCASAAGFECARFPVPLDRAGVVPGAVNLNVIRRVSPGNTTRTAVVALAGGPGQAAVPLAQDFATILAPALGTRDLLTFDQRGTGASDPLSCPNATQRARSIVDFSSGCAEEIGAGRGNYRTIDSVEDLEALRVAGEYDRLVLFGVSYGTKVALEYAARHPAQVEALVLDSVVAPEGPDPFRRSSLAATARITNDVCAGTACAAATANAAGDLNRLTARLRRGALRGSVISNSGRRISASLTQGGLFSIFLAGDLNPLLRAELPGAVRAALAGDRTPLLRLSVRSAGLDNAYQSDTVESQALFLATTCEESPFAWTRTAGVDQRTGEIQAAARAIPAGTLGPFTPSTALTGGVIPLCVGWPTASPPPEPTPPLPAVRTLILDGQFDVRTPLEDALAISGRVPGAEIVSIPYTGHSVLGSDLSSCAAGAVATFFSGAPAAPCAPGDNPFAPTPRPPRSLDVVKPTAVAGKAGRTLSAALGTITDARRQMIGEAFATGRVPARVGGLRSGTVSRSGTGLRLDDYEYVPGVTVSGRVSGAGAGTLRIRGSAAAGGTIRRAASGAVTGTLGGRRVTLAAATRSGDDLPSLTQVLARATLRQSGF